MKRARQVLAALSEDDESALQAELGLQPFSSATPIPHQDGIIAFIESIEAQNRDL